MIRPLLLVLAAALAAPALAHDDDHDDGRARLSGAQEVPAVSTAGTAVFRARLEGPQLAWELRYAGLESDATQAHIHFGQRGANGGIVVFLCSNLGNAPAGTPACPLRAGTLSGRAAAADVIGPAGQGIAPGEWDEFVRAMRAGLTYANVHSVDRPAGELRGQFRLD